MQTVTVAEAAEKLTDLIDAALPGEEIVITIMRSHNSTYSQTTCQALSCKSWNC